MKRAVLILALVAAFCVTRTIQLSCLKCETAECPSEESLNCKHGVGKDVCNCCPACLKGPGESCGGLWGTLGACGEKYDCKTKHGTTPSSQEEGTCQEKTPSTDTIETTTPEDSEVGSNTTDESHS